MTALQKAFSRHEKVKRMLINLEEMKQRGEVGEEQYLQLKTQYDGILDLALTNLKEIRTRLKAEREQVQKDLEILTTEANDIEVRGKVGELSPDQVTRAMGTIQAKKDECQKMCQKMEAWLNARSSHEVGCFIDVDINQKVEYRSEGRLDWDNMNKLLGGITQKISGLDSEKVAESLGNVMGKVYKKAGEVKKRSDGKNKIWLFVGIGAIVLILAAAWIMKPGAGSKPGSVSGAKPEKKQEQRMPLDEKVILGIIQKGWAKETIYLDMEVGGWSRQLLQELAKTGLIVASDPNMNSFRAAVGMESLITGDNNSFKLHIAQADNLQVLRFSKPAEAAGMMVSYVEYQYSWKPTELLTSDNYQVLRDAMRHQLAQMEPKLKISVGNKITLGLFTDGWSILQR